MTEPDLYSLQVGLILSLRSCKVLLGVISVGHVYVLVNFNLSR